MSAEVHVVDKLPAYALDCLDQDELVAVSEHLAVCPACRDQLRAYQETVGQLALAVSEVAPPPALKERLLAQIQTPATGTTGSVTPLNLVGVAAPTNAALGGRGPHSGPYPGPE